MAMCHDIILFMAYFCSFFSLSSCFSSSPHVHHSPVGGIVRIRYGWENAWKRKRIYIVLFFDIVGVFLDCAFFLCWGVLVLHWYTWCALYFFAFVFLSKKKMKKERIPPGSLESELIWHITWYTRKKEEWFTYHFIRYRQSARRPFSKLTIACQLVKECI